MNQMAIEIYKTKAMLSGGVFDPNTHTIKTSPFRDFICPDTMEVMATYPSSPYTPEVSTTTAGWLRNRARFVYEWHRDGMPGTFRAYAIAHSLAAADYVAYCHLKVRRREKTFARRANRNGQKQLT